MDKLKLINKAKEARNHAYAPYSNFSVGACLLAKNGKVYCGCNIESATHTPTICAERTAFAQAVFEGEREFVAIAVVGALTGKDMTACPPCGVCRQFMKEFCSDEFVVLLGTETDEFVETTLGELMPMGFGGDDLKK